ncbi:MAG TPA: hypothetical protein VEF04_22510 [Blastocatellia bacterium]|nr:hypothetical protein [Blastocatellia bacterium]
MTENQRVAINFRCPKCLALVTEQPRQELWRCKHCRCLFGAVKTEASLITQAEQPAKTNHHLKGAL